MSRSLLVVNLLLTLTLSALTSHAAVEQGENLLVNALFEADQMEFPAFWTKTESEMISHHNTGGPEGRSIVTISSPHGDQGTATIRQQGLKLVEGGTYKISAYIRTKGWSCRGYGVIVHNNGWIRSIGISSLPSDSEWTLHEQTFKIFPSKNSEYGVAIYAVNPRGEMSVTDVRLEAISSDALAGSSSQLAILNSPRIVPLSPLLNRIPANKPELNISISGNHIKSGAPHYCLATIDGHNAPLAKIPLDGDRATVSLKGLPPGDHTLLLDLRQQDSGTSLIKRRFPITIIEQPELDLSSIRELNSLVSELLATPLKAQPQANSFTFVRPQDGWIYIALSDNTTPDKNITAELDGKPLQLWTQCGNREAFQLVKRGTHTISISNSTPGVQLRINAIPEIFNYPPCVNSYVRENGNYDWNFMQHHILPAVTTLNGGKLPDPALKEARERGLLWLANCNVSSATPAETLKPAMENHPGIQQPHYDGITSDELFFSNISIDNYTKILWDIENPEQRLIYTWIVGKPHLKYIHSDFISSTMNTSGGRGRLLFEAYCHPQPNEKAAAAYLKNKVLDTIVQFENYLPGAVNSTGMIFGNFNQIPILALEHNPAVDFKYYLDMQLNMVATRPEFKNLATVGYWGTYYGDEEMVRWSFALLRHYAVNGAREMLSTRYGFAYSPNLLINGDFNDKLQGWVVEEGSDGGVTADRLSNYGRVYQGRWGAGSAGDNFCLFKRSANAPNQITQKISGMEPNRIYTLQFVTASHDDITAKLYKPRQYGIGVELDSGEIDDKLSFIHIDRRKETRSFKNLGKVNLHRIVFRATAPTLTLRFHDSDAKPDEKLMLNYIQLKPYFSGSASSL